MIFSQLENTFFSLNSECATDRDSLNLVQEDVVESYSLKLSSTKKSAAYSIPLEVLSIIANILIPRYTQYHGLVIQQFTVIIVYRHIVFIEGNVFRCDDITLSYYTFDNILTEICIVILSLLMNIMSSMSPF